jgi:hypothetical protein
MLVLYTIAAFLSAPGWQFEAIDSSAASQLGGNAGGLGMGRGMTLYLGSIPPRPPPQYSAVLAYRPDKPGKGVDALLALGQQGGAGEGFAQMLMQTVVMA